MPFLKGGENKDNQKEKAKDRSEGFHSRVEMSPSIEGKRRI